MTVHPDSPLESNIEAQRFTGIELGRGKEQGRWPLKMPTSVCGRGRERERERGISFFLNDVSQYPQYLIQLVEFLFFSLLFFFKFLEHCAASFHQRCRTFRSLTSFLETKFKIKETGMRQRVFKVDLAFVNL